jgi:hypothetical protein
MSNFVQNWWPNAFARWILYQGWICCLVEVTRRNDLWALIGHRPRSALPANDRNAIAVHLEPDYFHENDRRNCMNQTQESSHLSIKDHFAAPDGLGDLVILFAIHSTSKMLDISRCKSCTMLWLLTITEKKSGFRSKALDGWLDHFLWISLREGDRIERLWTKLIERFQTRTRHLSSQAHRMTKIRKILVSEIYSVRNYNDPWLSGALRMSRKWLFVEKYGN